MDEYIQSSDERHRYHRVVLTGRRLFGGVCAAGLTVRVRGVVERGGRRRRDQDRRRGGRRGRGRGRRGRSAGRGR